MAEKLTAVEVLLVEIHRQSDRDVLRNPAGLNDTLLALISTVSLSDTAQTKLGAAVAREIMARVDGFRERGTTHSKAWDDFACGTA